ncbi:AlbA family DNA-binding domain-containing protein, partial [Actinacidiphila acidipaludis]
MRTLLGAAPGEATYAQYRTLLRNPSAVEAADLDYKGEQYGRKPDWQVELAKDVAALANASGGTLVLGLYEDRATSIPQQPNPESLTDRLRKKYRETLVLRVEPAVDCEIHFIAEDPDASVPRGLVVISVPPSARGPHAVVGTTDLRDGTLS